MKTLHNIWDLEQLSNYTLREIAFELDLHLYGIEGGNYNSLNKSKLVGVIYNELRYNHLTDMTEMIDYLIGLVKEEKITLESH
tara:strand:+ start:294 stop:542 length:249 start_codon:yes stop_codon:yes gene_type:complete